MPLIYQQQIPIPGRFQDPPGIKRFKLKWRPKTKDINRQSTNKKTKDNNFRLSNIGSGCEQLTNGAVINIENSFNLWGQNHNNRDCPPTVYSDQCGQDPGHEGGQVVVGRFTWATQDKKRVLLWTRPKTTPINLIYFLSYCYQPLWTINYFLFILVYFEWSYLTWLILFIFIDHLFALIAHHLFRFILFNLFCLSTIYTCILLGSSAWYMKI